MAVYRRIDKINYELLHLIEIEARSDISYIKIINEEDNCVKIALHDSLYQFFLVCIDEKKVNIQKTLRKKLEKKISKNEEARDRVKLFYEINIQ
jgi:hypothetical protein